MSAPNSPSVICDLYLAWLAGYGTWERDEHAFDDAAENEAEPPVPAGLGSLTAPQRALADFLRLDTDLLASAAQARSMPASPGPSGRGAYGRMPDHSRVS